MPQPDLAQEKKGKHRSIYAAGYYAGLKAAEQGVDILPTLKDGDS